MTPRRLCDKFESSVTKEQVEDFLVVVNDGTQTAGVFQLGAGTASSNLTQRCADGTERLPIR